MSYVHNTEYQLKIPVKIKKKLCKILKLSSRKLKFEELSSLFLQNYKRKLELLFRDNNEIIIIEINYDDNYAAYLNREQNLMKDESEVKYPDDELEQFRDYMSKIDFNLEFTKKSKMLLSHDSRIHLSQYFKINIRLPFPEKPSGSFTEDPEVKKTLSRKILQNFFDIWHWRVDDIVPIFIANIYDPLKFWIRLFPIDVFETLICDFYDPNRNTLSIELSDLCIGLNCVAFVSNFYCRARIVRQDIENQNTVKIFLYDYGILSKVHTSELYHLDETFSMIPAFAVRAMLTNISSLDNKMWSQNTVDRFVELTDNKPLIAQIAHIHIKRKILEIHLLDSRYQKKGKIPTINYRLVYDGLAKYSSQLFDDKKEEKRQFKPLKELLHLYPSFEMIENGLAPSQVYLTEDLKQCLPLDVIFPEFYEYQVQNE